MSRAAFSPLGDWSVVRAAATSRLVPLALLLASCSVYSGDLLGDAAAGVVQGAAGSGAGTRTSSVGGSSGLSGAANLEPPAPGSDTEGGEAPAGQAGGGPGVGTAGAGSPGVGGSSGDPGPSTAGAAGRPGSPPDNLLDGFEDADLTLEPTDGRGGVWYLFDDGTLGSAGPTPLTCAPLTGAPLLLGGYALRITATGFADWGSGLGVDFRAGKKPYDARKLSGLRFWARVGAGKNTHHRVQIADATTDKAGLVCDPAPAAPEGKKCDDHFGVNETFTTSWALYSIRFDELSQIGWGNPGPALDTSALYGLQITAKAKLDVELWLDQLELF